MIKGTLEVILTFFFRIFFFFNSKSRNSHLMDTIKLYRENGFKYLFLQIRAWDGPFEEIEKLIPQFGTFLDLGCGDGLLSNFLAVSSPHRKIIGIEINKDRIKIADKGLKNTKFYSESIMNTDFPKVEGVLLIDVLHHLNSFQDQEIMLKKCFEKLKNKGVLIIAEISSRPFLKYLFTRFTDMVIVPILFEKKLMNFNVFFRSTKDWIKLLKSYGFTVLTKEIHNGKPFSHVLFVCKKIKIIDLLDQ